MDIKTVRTDDEYEILGNLFRDYQDYLGIDLCFQNFEKELTELPDQYGPPKGGAFLAMDNDLAAGCVAVRNFDGDICEMKRLYVRPAFHGRGLGRKLARAIVRAGRDLGYKEMRLDTLSSMKEAIGLYESLGFSDIEPYRENPFDGVRYMELAL